jgi:Mg2+ and Co2+ transporter CorA
MTRDVDELERELVELHAALGTALRLAEGLQARVDSALERMDSETRYADETVDELERLLRGES